METNYLRAKKGDKEEGGRLDQAPVTGQKPWGWRQKKKGGKNTHIPGKTKGSHSRGGKKNRPISLVKKKGPPRSGGGNVRETSLAKPANQKKNKGKKTKPCEKTPCAEYDKAATSRDSRSKPKHKKNIGQQKNSFPVDPPSAK